MKNSNLKIPNFLDLGTVLPGHFGQSILPLFSSQAAFLNLALTPHSIQSGFFLLKEGNSECAQSLNMVLKPGKKIQILIGSYPKQTLKSMDLRGELIISENNQEHKIKIHTRIQVPKLHCKKMLEDTTNNLKLVRLVVNKAVTSDVRIPLFNPEDYPLDLEVGLLVKSSIGDRQNPFIMKVHGGTVKAESKQQFFVFLNIQTNIGYKNDPKGLKKVVCKNVLTLKTNSAVIWCLPMEIIVVFVKQPQFKSDD